MARKYLLVPETEWLHLKEEASMKVVNPTPEQSDVEIRIIEEKPKNATNNLEDQVLDLLPDRLKKRALRILMHIRQHSDMITLGDNGTVMIKQQVLPGSNMADYLNDLLVSIRRKKYEPPAMQDFLRALAMTHLPETTIVNGIRRKQLRKYRQAMPNLKKPKKTTNFRRYFS